MKLVNKLKKVLLIFIMTIFMFGSINVDALSETLTTNATTWPFESASYKIAGMTFGKKSLEGGNLVYCLEHHKKSPIAGLKYTKSSDLTNGKYVGILYILENGYPNKSITGKADPDYYITQSAIHWYIDRVNGIPDSQDGEATKAFKKSNAALSKYVQVLVNGAVDAYKSGTYNNTPTITLNGNPVMSPTEDKDYWISQELGVETNGNVKKNYTVSLSGQPTGTVIVDSDGNIKKDSDGNAVSTATFSTSESFKIMIPAASIVGDTSFKVNATIDGTKLKIYSYTTSNDDYQDIIVSDKVSVTASDDMNLIIFNSSATNVQLAKVDSSNNYIANAKLRLTFEINGVTDSFEFTTSNKALPITFPTGKYYLEEVTPPEGYVKSNEKKCFEISGTGSISDCNGNEYTDSTVTISIKNDKNNIKIRKLDENGNVLDGATLVLSKIVLNEDGSLNKDELKFALWTTGKNNASFYNGWTTGSASKEDSDGYTTFSSLMPGLWVVMEYEQPEGYVASSEMIYLYVTEDGNIIDLDGNPLTTISFKNEKTVTKIYKKDISGNEIPGARLRVLNESNQVVDEWTSTTEPHEIQGLVAGKTYTLEETIAPSGYALTSAIQFTVNEDGSVTEVTLTNEVITLVISKQDITNNKELPGATLIIRDKDGNEYLKWVSGEEPKVIEMIPAGTYTLEEITSPDGYILNSEKITFIVNEDGTITDENGNKIDQVIMYNTPETPVPKTAANIPMFVYIIGLLALAGGAKIIYTKLKHN